MMEQCTTYQCPAFKGIMACYLDMWYSDPHFDSDWGYWYMQVESGAQRNILLTNDLGWRCCLPYDQTTI